MIINTCVVTDRTEKNMIKRLCQLQGERLVIAGCLPAAMPETVQDIRCQKVMGILDRSAGQKMGKAFRSEETRPRHLPPAQNLCAVINISEGCKGRCSYCIVRRARGALRSKTVQEVTEEIQRRQKEGAVEIQLASQDAAAYGLDLGSSLPELLDAVVRIDGDFRVRVGMMNPDLLSPILENLIRSYEDPKIYKFLHLPVQSGSDRVLDSMKRGYEARDFLDMAARFRAAFPDLTLYTDVISGFPGETDEDSRATEDLIRAADPDKVNVTRYSSRPGTVASKLKDMPSRFKKDRSRRMTRLWQEIAGRRNGLYLGKTLVVQVTERGREGTMMARSPNYRKTVIHEPLLLGSVHRLRIVKTSPFYLVGELASRK